MILKGNTFSFQLNPNYALDKDGNSIPIATLKDVIQRSLETWNNQSHSYTTFTISRTPYNNLRSRGHGISSITLEDLRYTDV